MNAVFLDYASLDQNDLDFQALAAQFSQFEMYEKTQASEVTSRIQHAEVVITNKVVINAEHMQQAAHL